LVALFSWLFTKIIDAIPPVSQEIAYLQWTGYVFAYIFFVAFVLWIFSRVNKQAWKVIAGTFGWKEDEGGGD